MMHFSCDLCGRDIGRERYEVQLSIGAAFDPDELTDQDLDADNLALVAEELEALGGTGEFVIEETGPKQLRYDLCVSCARRYASDPLARHAMRQPRYSKN
ncbi:MAG: hypothetical protein R3B90_07150 [Planctomycetaceae bacterium]